MDNVTPKEYYRANYGDDDFVSAEQEARESHMATPAEADREYARNVGMDKPQRAWILSDRDVWYANPFYSGPPVAHPESDF